MPFSPYFFADAKLKKEQQVYTNILLFLDPKTFLEAAKLTHFFCHERDPENHKARDLAKALDTIKRETSTIFASDDTCLSANVSRLSGGLTNASFKLKTNKGSYFLRIPGAGSEDHISREDENYNLKVVLSDLKINIQVYFFDAKGMYIGEFLDNARPLTGDLLTQKQTILDVAALFRILHKNPVLFRNNLDIISRLERLYLVLQSYKPKQTIMSMDKIQASLKRLEQQFQNDPDNLVACHNDPNLANFLYQGKTLKLLDWEYASNNKPLYDLANFSCSASLTQEQDACLLTAYCNQQPTQNQWEIFNNYKPMVYFWYYLWAEVQLANQSNEVPEEELQQIAEENGNKFAGPV